MMLLGITVLRILIFDAVSVCIIHIASQAVSAYDNGNLMWNLVVCRGVWCGYGVQGGLNQHHFWMHHDDVIKWKHFLCYWPFVQGIHRSPVNFPHKGQWCRALMFSLICAWINGGAGDLRRHRTHYDVTVMTTRLLEGLRKGIIKTLEKLKPIH